MDMYIYILLHDLNNLDRLFGFCITYNKSRISHSFHLLYTTFKELRNVHQKPNINSNTEIFAILFSPIYTNDVFSVVTTFTLLSMIINNVVAIIVQDFQVPVHSMPITTKVVCSNPAHGEIYSILHYVIKCISDLQQVGDFLRIFRFSPPIN